MNALRIGAKLHNYGPVDRFPFLDCAIRAEEAGFDSVWLSDHVIFPERVASTYPFTDDGEIDWPVDTPWYDPIVAMSAITPVTKRVEIGVGVLVLAMRHPIVVAKQLSSIDALSGGRVVLAVGAGWLAEEFEALGVPFDSRGERLDEWIELLRECWTGRPAEHLGPHYQLPGGYLTLPTPVRPVPIVVGGMSAVARRRAGGVADGWYPLLHRERDETQLITQGAAEVRQAAADSGKPPPSRLIVRREGPAQQVVRELPVLLDAGATDVVVDVDWSQPDGPQSVLELVRSAAVRA